MQKQALREIVPTDAAASAFKSAKSTATAVMNTLADRLGGSFEVSGRSGGDLVAGKASVWAQGLLNHAKMTDGFKADTAGFAAGVETNLTDSFKLGAGYAYASTDIKTDRSKTDADTHTGFVYGEYAPDALYVNAMLSFGRSDYDDTTRAAGMKSSYRADAYGARVAAGYALGLLTPEAAVRQKAYTDALGARVAAKNLNTATMVVGAKAAKTFTVGKYAVTPEAKAAVTYDFARPNESRRQTDERSRSVADLRRRVQDALPRPHGIAEYQSRVLTTTRRGTLPVGGCCPSNSLEFASLRQQARQSPPWSARVRTCHGIATPACAGSRLR